MTRSIALWLGLPACEGDPGDRDAEADADADTDTDSDSDADTDSDGDTDPLGWVDQDLGDTVPQTVDGVTVDARGSATCG